ncbi:MAG: hypothetical protein JO161_09435 [Planctomycetaceae bacterium]|nr:hypothetical protein [Planctomycetaceae bacterium]
MNTAVIEVETMAKRPRGRPKTERDDVSVKIDRALLDKARLVAAHRKVALAELVTELLRTPIERVYQQMVRELSGKEGQK